MRLNKRLLPLALLALVVAIAPARAQGDYFVTIPFKGVRLIQDLEQRNIEVLAVSKDMTLDLLVPEKQLDYVYSLGLPVSAMPIEQMRTSASQLDENLGLYHTYDEMIAKINSFQSTYPTLAQVSTIGTTIEGRSVYLLKVSDNVGTDEDEGEALYMGCHP